MPIENSFFFDNSDPIITELQDSYKETIEDYRIKWDNCYGLLYNEAVLFEEFIIDDDDGVSVSVKKLRTGQHEYIDFHEIYSSIDWTSPELGAINLEESVLFCRRSHIQRSPARYRAGFRPDILSIFNPNSWELINLSKPCLSKADLSKRSALDKIALNILERKEYSYEEALDSVLSFDRLGAAFSTNYYFTLNSIRNQFLMWRDDTIIGTYDTSKKEFNMITDIFDDDLSYWRSK